MIDKIICGCNFLLTIFARKYHKPTDGNPFTPQTY